MKKYITTVHGVKIYKKKYSYCAQYNGSRREYPNLGYALMMINYMKSKGQI